MCGVNEELAVDRFSQAYRELRIAQRALQRMKEGPGFEIYEDEWKRFLDAIGKIREKTWRACSHFKEFPKWKSDKENERMGNALINYLFHARHADNHTLEKMLTHEAGKFTLKSGPSGIIHIQNLEIRGGDISLQYSGEKPIAKIDPPRIRLLPVRNRSNLYNPPTSHGGNYLTFPHEYAEIAIEYYEKFINEAKDKFGD